MSGIQQLWKTLNRQKATHPPACGFMESWPPPTHPPPSHKPHRLDDDENVLPMSLDFFVTHLPGTFIMSRFQRFTDCGQPFFDRGSRPRLSICRAYGACW